MPADADLDGTRQLQAALRGLSEGLGDEFAAAMADSADVIVGDAQRRVPVRSGAARRSIRGELADDGARIVAGGRVAPYFNIIEYGSKYIRGGHHIRRAVEASLDDIEQAAARAVTDEARDQGLI